MSDAATQPLTVLVTGATGFLGRHVCADLASSGMRVRAMVRRRDDVASIAGVEHVVADLSDVATLHAATAGVDAIVHLAGRAHVVDRDRAESERVFNAVNDEGTRELLRAGIDSGLRHFVHVSSIAAVCSTSPVPVRETTPPRPESPYGESKLASEHTVRAACDAAGVGYSILRPPMIYGPGMKGNPLRLFEHVARGMPVPVCGTANRRTILFVKNFVAIVHHLLTAPLDRRETYHVGDDGTVSTASLTRLIAEGLGRQARIATIPTIAVSAARKLPVPRVGAALDRLCGSLELDSRHLTATTGFRPPFTTADGIGETARWFAARSRA